jgi:hypothetical protein
MPYYCVNKNAQPNSRDHEVHDVSSTKGCLPDPANRISLGYHATCRGAVTEAKKYFNDVNGCYYCANDCHTS